jgi:predicted transcriptional regulator
MPRPPGIGQAELEILHYIHDHHPVTVRDVAEYVSRTKGHTRTTVLNVMARLVRKGYLTRRKAEGVYRYEPRVPKGDLMRGMVRDFVERALGGSLSPFVAYLAEDADVSDDELRELKQLVRDLGKQQQQQQQQQHEPKGGRK